MSTTIPGGYSDWNFTITPEAQKVFNEAVRGLVGVRYEPFACAKQVVAGVNYSFLAKSHPVIPNPPVQVVKIRIFAPLPNQGSVKLDGIEQICP